MKKVNFGSSVLRILFGFLIISLIIVLFNLTDKYFFGWTLIPIDYHHLIFISLIVFSSLAYLKYNYILYNHDTLVIKMNRIFSKKISFKFIEDYKIENKQLLIYLRDNSEKKFSLRHVNAKDIERLDYIIDIHVQDFL